MNPEQPKQEPVLSTADRLKQCAVAIDRACKEHNCQMYTALKVGNAETPLGEIAGLPIIIKLAANDQ